MHNRVKALITAVILEAASLACIGIGYGIGEWNYKIKRTEHFLIDLGLAANLPGAFFPWLAGSGSDPFGGVASWAITILANVACWFLFWLIIYEGLSGMRSRWTSS